MSLTRITVACAVVVAVIGFGIADVRAQDSGRDRVATAGPAEWIRDIRYLVRQVEYRHPNPGFFGPTREQFRTAADELVGSIDDLPPWRIPWEVSRLLARLWDGHTWVDCHTFGPFCDMVPVQFASFDEGLFVVAAAEPHTAWIGAKVRRLGRLSWTELCDRAHEQRLTSFDNDASMRWWLHWHVRMPSALAVLGAIAEPGSVEYEFERDGRVETVELNPLPRAQRLELEWSALGARLDGSVGPKSEPLFAAVRHPDRDALHLRYNGFRDDPKRDWRRFCRATFEWFDRDERRRLVLDLRSNNGGDPDFGIPLLHAIIERPQLRKPGGLVVLIGGKTDSAAVSFCALLEAHAAPVFVGSPTYLRPNGHANAAPFELPNTGISARISTMYWRAAHPRDRRPWIAPHVPVPVRFADARARRDRALEVALGGPEPLAATAFEPVLGKGTAGVDLRAALTEWRGELANRWADAEPRINAIGYELMRAGRLDDAIAVFELNRQLHPWAWNVHDSLAEACLKRGDRVRALSLYRESVRRFPGNTAAIDTILDLETASPRKHD